MCGSAQVLWPAQRTIWVRALTPWAMASTTCMGRCSDSASICVLQEKPSATRSASGGVCDSRVKQPLARDSHRQVVVGGLEPERAGQAAAPRVEHLDLEPEPLEQRLLVVDAHDRLVVTVAVHGGPALPPRRVPVLAVPLEELGHGEGLQGQAL